MYPDNQNQPPQWQQQNSMDYLDSISGQQKVNTVNPLLLWGMIGGVLLLVMAVFFVLIGSAGGQTQGERLTSFVYRMNALEELGKSNAKELKSSNLRALNSNMTTILTGASAGAATPLAANGVEELPAQPEGSPIAIEFATTQERLENARLNVEFDTVYAREAAYHLAKVRADITAISQASNDQQTKAYLEELDSNLEPIVQQFTDYNDAQDTSL